MSGTGQVCIGFLFHRFENPNRGRGEPCVRPLAGLIQGEYKIRPYGRFR